MPRTNAAARQHKEAAEILKKAGVKIGFTFSPHSTKSTKEISKLINEDVGEKELRKMIKTNDPIKQKLVAKKIKIMKLNKQPNVKYAHKLMHNFGIRGIFSKIVDSLTGAKRKKINENGRRFLLSEKKPFSASVFLPEIIKNAEKFNDVYADLRKTYGDKFTGIVVFGSVSKGYAVPKSDVDYAVIASDKKIAKKFRLECKKKNLPLCVAHYIDSGRMAEIHYLDKSPLFHGLFFGDKNGLRNLQINTFESLNSVKWNKLRERIYLQESYLNKAFVRFNIKDKKEKLRLKIAAGLRVPPTYDEMKQIVAEWKRAFKKRKLRKLTP